MSTTRKKLGVAARQAAVFPPARRMAQIVGGLWGRSQQFYNLYSHEPPTPATGFNIFKNEWSSAVPGFQTGVIDLFNDKRIKWLQSQFGSFHNKRVLELGPLEGGHTWMMEQAGANVLGIEANQRGFLKCLIVKNALHLKSEFLYGDFRPYLETAAPSSFDFISAIGVLYHMTEPVKLLHDIARVADAFGIWTHYYDRDIIGAKQLRFEPQPSFETVEGKSVEGYRQHYLSAVAVPGFCGGSAPTSFWLTKKGLLEYIQSIGFEVTVGEDDVSHPTAPCILLYARRTR